MLINILNYNHVNCSLLRPIENWPTIWIYDIAVHGRYADLGNLDLRCIFMPNSNQIECFGRRNDNLPRLVAWNVKVHISLVLFLEFFLLILLWVRKGGEQFHLIQFPKWNKTSSYSGKTFKSSVSGSWSGEGREEVEKESWWRGNSRC